MELLLGRQYDCRKCAGRTQWAESDSSSLNLSCRRLSVTSWWGLLAGYPVRVDTAKNYENFGPVLRRNIYEGVDGILVLSV